MTLLPSLSTSSCSGIYITASCTSVQSRWILWTCNMFQESHQTGLFTSILLLYTRWRSHSELDGRVGFFFFFAFLSHLNTSLLRRLWWKMAHFSVKSFSPPQQNPPKKIIWKSPTPSSLCGKTSYWRGVRHVSVKLITAELLMFKFIFSWEEIDCKNAVKH